jgi:hypothetical protein
MDVSFSAWRHAREESLQLKGESFSFLFDRRYTNRLNRMSRVFFEAYVVATKELAAQEDRFPSLSEIDAKMESGAVYAFKDRLMKSTEFFEEVKISGVSYLVPRALRFVDASGTYTDLILNFEEGAAVLPTRRKTPAPPEPLLPSAEEIRPTERPAEPEIVAAKPVPSPPESAPQPGQSTIPEPALDQYPAHSPQTFAELENAARETPAATLLQPPEAIQADAIPADLPSKTQRLPDKPAASGRMDRRYAAVALAGAALLLAAAAVLFGILLPQSPLLPQGPPTMVEYSALLSNSSNESYIGLDIHNPKGMSSEMEMVLPPEIDQSISARGGVVTISHADGTLVRMNSSSDASVKIYLLGNWTMVPVSLNLAEPEGYDSSLVVHGKDYFVTRKNDTLVLRFNLTGESVSFEQSYSPRR